MFRNKQNSTAPETVQEAANSNLPLLPPTFGRGDRASLRRRFPRPDFSSEVAMASSLERLLHHAEEVAEYFILYYEKQARRRMWLANFLRTLAILSLLVGASLAAGRLLSQDWQESLVKFVMGNDAAAPASTRVPTTVPAELGLILFGIAAGMLLADRFGNISANWLRYRTTAMQLDRRLVEFRLAWWDSMLRPAPVVETTVVEGQAALPPAPPDPRTQAMAKLTAVSAFVASTFDLVDSETREWVNLFRQSQHDFETYLRTANEAARERAAQAGPANAPGTGPARRRIQA